MGFGFGGLLNSITGASDSAKTSAKYTSWLNAQNNAYQKEAMQNAHQWEVEDLKKAKLNPALAINNGASTGGIGGSGGSIGMQAGAGGFSDIINTASGLMKLASEIKNIDQDTELKGALTGKTPHEIEEIDSRTNINQARIKEISSVVMLNTAKALEARMNAEYQKRKASGKGIQINTPFGGGGFNW